MPRPDKRQHLIERCERRGAAEKPPEVFLFYDIPQLFLREEGFDKGGKTRGQSEHRKPPAEERGSRRGQCRGEQGACARRSEPRGAPDPGGNKHARAEREAGSPRRRAPRPPLFLLTVKRRLCSGCVAARAAERHGLNDGRRKILRAVIERAVVRQDTADHDARARHGGDCGGRRLPPALFTFVPIHLRPSLPGGTPRRTPRPSCTRAGDSSRAA